MVVHQVVSETTPYQIQKKFDIPGKFLLRKSYLRCMTGYLDSIFASDFCLVRIFFIYFSSDEDG